MEQRRRWNGNEETKKNIHQVQKKEQKRLSEVAEMERAAIRKC